MFSALGMDVLAGQVLWYGSTGLDYLGRKYQYALIILILAWFDIRRTKFNEC